MTDQILKIFNNKQIKSQEKLKKYINFCIQSNKSKRIKNLNGYSMTALHHILPKSLFPEYKNLKENIWNGVHLLHSDHYYAHWLLCAVFDYKNYSINEAFLKMHQCDINLNRILEKDLINHKEFQIFYEKALMIRGNKISEYMNTEITLKDGSISTIAKERGKKISASHNKIFLNKEGKETTIAKERCKNRNNFIPVIEISTNTRKAISSEEYKKNKHLYKTLAKEKYSKEENIKNIERQTDIREIHIKNFIYSTKSGIPLRTWLKENNLPYQIYQKVLNSTENTVILKLGKNNKNYKKFNNSTINIIYKYKKEHKD